MSTTSTEKVTNKVLESVDDPKELLSAILHELYGEETLSKYVLNPDKEWDADTLTRIAGLFDAYGCGREAIERELIHHPEVASL